MKLLEIFGETLTKEWEKLPGFVKLGTILVVILEGLVLFTVKDEVLAILNRIYLGREQELLLGIVIIIIPLLSFLTAFLIVKIFSKQSRKSIPSTDLKPSPIAQIHAEIPANYQLIKEISKSGFSRVLLVREKGSNEEYLMKELINKPSDGLKDFPNISGLAAPISRFQHRGHVYELLKYHTGWTLAEIIEINRDNIGVCGALLVDWAEQLFKILTILHQNSPPIIHRDINPSNILVRSDTLELVLLDLSCAVYASSRSSQNALGTPHYSAPEQLNGKAVLSSDLYSLGMTLYAINRCEIPPSSSARYNRQDSLTLVNLTPWTGLEGIFAKCIALEPNNRFKDASEALHAFHPIPTQEIHHYGVLHLPLQGKIDINNLSWQYTAPGRKSISRNI
jgi:serine/threonine protein kinase